MIVLRIPLEAIPDAYDFEDSEDRERPSGPTRISLAPKVDGPPATAPAGRTRNPGFHRQRLFPRVIL